MDDSNTFAGISKSEVTVSGGSSPRELIRNGSPPANSPLHQPQSSLSATTMDRQRETESNGDDAHSETSSYTEDYYDSENCYTSSDDEARSLPESISRHRQKGPQHPTEAPMETEMIFDMNALIKKNRRIILARLKEAAPLGQLSVINLSRRSIGVKEAEMLKQVIQNNPRLSVLRLCYNRLGDEGASILADAIYNDGNHHAGLSLLDLGFNDIGDVGCVSLAGKALASNMALQTLYLSCNQIGEDGAVAIATAILQGTGIESLYLSGNRLGENGVKAIAGATATSDATVANRVQLAPMTPQTPLHLFMDNTKMTHTAFHAVTAMLSTNSTLRTLSLSNNGIDDADMLVLAQALTQNKRLPLEELALSFNKVTSQGIETLMNAIWGSLTLKRLKLDNNQLKDRGAQLCAVVLTSITLETLDVSFNPITNVGLRALMKNISENTSLKILGLCGIPIDQNASKAVSYALAYNSSLEAVYMDNCSTGYSVQRHIVAGIVSNRRASLRALTGFSIGPIAETLGVPRLPGEWSNEQVLGFFRMMWRQWRLKSGRGDLSAIDDIRGPAPPAAVAAASKIAFASLGTVPSTALFQSETHEKPLSEGPPIDPPNLSLIMRSPSGTMLVPEYPEPVDPELMSPDAQLSDNASFATGSVAMSYSSKANGKETFYNSKKRNHNLQWLRQHSRALTDIGRLPFNNADLWQLHQFYFSPPLKTDEKEDETAASTGDASTPSLETGAEDAKAPPPTPATVPAPSPSMGRAISFRVLGNAFAASGLQSRGLGQKRGHGKGHDGEPAAKKARSAKPRIAYYPRIMAEIQLSGSRPMDRALSLLRQLKYAENVMFMGKDPYDVTALATDDCSHSDIEMILLDLL